MHTTQNAVPPPKCLSAQFVCAVQTLHNPAMIWVDTRLAIAIVVYACSWALEGTEGSEGTESWESEKGFDIYPGDQLVKINFNYGESVFIEIKKTKQHTQTVSGLDFSFGWKKNQSTGSQTKCWIEIATFLFASIHYDRYLRTHFQNYSPFEANSMLSCWMRHQQP